MWNHLQDLVATQSKQVGECPLVLSGLHDVVKLQTSIVRKWKLVLC